ncbi:hypothetical protein D3C73_1461610 [compost metagenome]
MPSMTAPTPKATIAVVASSLRETTHGGRTGSAAFLSTKRKATNNTAPPAKTQMLIVESQAHAWPP